tara:strand:- start:157 stop:903 length:747 start_codon:yes stop_codon:yes gene_type:complete
MTEQFDSAQTLQNLLVSHATGGHESDADYAELRSSLLEEPGLRVLLPAFVRTCRNLDQFWQFIKSKFETYKERRAYLWSEFEPLLEHLESLGKTPSDAGVSLTLSAVNADAIQAAWQKALDRRQSDPEGAITMARSLLESVCKHILDMRKQSYEDKLELPKLYKLTAESLDLAPSQHTEQVFRQILGGCTAIVEGLGAVRNRLGDSHGKRGVAARPAPRHAELAVNLAGSMAKYLIETMLARDAQQPN